MISKLKIIFIILCSLISYNLNAYYYGKNKIQHKKIEWSVIESKHFDIHYVKGQDEFGQLTVLMAENAYYILNNFFKQPLKNRIPIIVYSSKQDFHTTNIIYPLLSEGVGGFTETLRNRVALPFDGSYKKFEEVLIHELTHAYINDIDNTFLKNPLFSSFSNYLPFWFSEGLPEFISIKGENDYNNMFIIDMVMNDYLYDIENLNGYFAYRLGEAFLVWLNEEWDQEKITEYFYNLRVQTDINLATKKTFNMDFYELQKRFKVNLKRKYSNLLNDFQIPWECSNIITTSKNNDSNQNIFPRIKDNDEYVYFSYHKGRTVIKLGSINKLFKEKIILTGEKDKNFEEFHFQRNNLSWFPDKENIAFVAKTSKGDHIYIYNINDKKIKKSIYLNKFDSIYELDISPDGNIISFSGQKNNKCDIFTYNIQTAELKQITNDNYQNSQPRWSNSGDNIAFVSERPSNIHQDLQDSLNTNIFKNLTKNIYTVNMQTSQISQLTFDHFDNFYPVWGENDSTLYFISNQKQISNVHSINLISSQRSIITNTLSGIHSFDLSLDNQTLIYSSYFDNSWEIYSMLISLEDIEILSYKTAEPVTFVNDFSIKYNTQRYKYYGRDYSIHKPNHKTNIDDYQQLRKEIKQDTLSTDFFKYFSRTFELDNSPDTTNYTIPITRSYKPKFKIDTFWGGMAYSSSYGTVGMLQLGLSDLMGDHGLGINIDFNGKIEDSNLVFSYMYLPLRIDYGFALYNLSDITLYKTRITKDYLELQETQTGGYFLIRYPLSKFFRLDFEQSLYRFKTEWAKWDKYTGKWNRTSVTRDWVYVPEIGFVFDNALYGSTGPMSGYKLNSKIRQGIRKTKKQIDFNDFTTFYSDYRAYYMISEKFALASRLIFGISNGKNPEKFNIEGFNGVRGFDDDNLKGDRKVLTTLELRYPLIDYLKIGFPIPLTIGNIRGSVFADLGSVWYDNQSFKGYDDGKLKDLKLGFGFGPRMNIGYFILKFDIAWNSNLAQHGKPSYYFSINEDF